MTIFYEPVGKIIQASETDVGEEVLSQLRQYFPNAQSIPGFAEPDKHYVWHFKVHPIPPSPGDGYEFDYVVKAWVRNDDVAWNLIRQERNRLLAASDWTQMADSPLSTEEQEDWAIYRQALRDITDQEDPDNIVWPIAPE